MTTIQDQLNQNNRVATAQAQDIHFDIEAELTQFFLNNDEDVDVLDSSEVFEVMYDSTDRVWTPSSHIKSISMPYRFGGEGQGDQYYFVLKMDTDDGDFYIRYNGSYDSWNGVEWDNDFEQVVPQQTVKTVYYRV